jgi:hypothetical protein
MAASVIGHTVDPPGAAATEVCTVSGAHSGSDQLTLVVSQRGAEELLDLSLCGEPG